MSLIDTGLVPDTYVDGIADVENLGTVFRTIYFVYTNSPVGKVDRLVVSKIVRPVEMVHSLSGIGGLAGLLANRPRLILPNQGLRAH